VCLTCVGGHNFFHSMNTHESFMRFDGLLDSFHVGWDEFVNMLIELMTEPHRGGFIARMNLSDSQ
jgi:hypothetical protein